MVILAMFFCLLLEPDANHDGFFLYLFFLVYENEDKLLWKPDAVDNRQCMCFAA